MAHPWHHALSSARKFGGQPEDYLALHAWFDASKAHAADFRHRVLRHHAEGIFACEREFGVTIRNSAGKDVPVRLIGEQHVSEDFAGFIPSLKDWIDAIQPKPWMMKTSRNVGRDVEGTDADRHQSHHVLQIDLSSLDKSSL